jgi:hypothetical protein
MLWRSVLTAFAAIIILAGSGVAQADYCLNIESGVFIIIGRGFKIPAKGACKSWVGFSAQNSHNEPSSGTGCTASDGSTLNFTIVTSFPESGGGFEQDSITLALPSQTGTDTFTFVDASGTSGLSVSVAGSKCKGTAVPSAVGVPSEGRGASQ